MNLEEFNKLIGDFENENLEFRTSSSTSEDKDRDIKTIAAFYNTRGGKIILEISPQESRNRRLFEI